VNALVEEALNLGYRAEKLGFNMTITPATV
jgi:hypothetical protein